MRRILLISPYRIIEIEIPLFGKMKSKVIKQSKMKGKSYNLLVVDETSKLPIS